ncbi:hypothetical protein NQD34_018345 [Periophthalmus magnuspinnatus]|nr:hypothetical protein NQD34_018345 [Periophthalmus magnuspinnatus]
MVESLGKLAFEQLQKGNLIFYECDLSECGLDAAAASVYSGVFTQVFREEQGLYQDKVYCFIHLVCRSFWLLFMSITPSSALERTCWSHNTPLRVQRETWRPSTALLWTRPYRVQTDTWTCSCASSWGCLCRPIRGCCRVC